MQDVTAYADVSPRYINNGVMRFDISGVAPMSAMGELQNLLHDGLRSQNSSYVKEWRCLYCTSPNSINKTHCTQCGAPRSFVIG